MERVGGRTAGLPEIFALDRLCLFFLFFLLPGPQASWVDDRSTFSQSPLLSTTVSGQLHELSPGLSSRDHQSRSVFDVDRDCCYDTVVVPEDLYFYMVKNYPNSSSHHRA